jgi:hypothetical protein
LNAKWNKEEVILLLVKKDKEIWRSSTATIQNNELKWDDTESFTYKKKKRKFGTETVQDTHESLREHQKGRTHYEACVGSLAFKGLRLDDIGVEVRFTELRWKR